MAHPKPRPRRRIPLVRTAPQIPMIYRKPGIRPAGRIPTISYALHATVWDTARTAITDSVLPAAEPGRCCALPVPAWGTVFSAAVWDTAIPASDCPSAKIPVSCAMVPEPAAAAATADSSGAASAAAADNVTSVTASTTVAIVTATDITIISFHDYRPFSDRPQTNIKLPGWNHHGTMPGSL